MNAVDVSETGPVEGWMEQAVASIDAQFGEGYARANPVLVGAFMQACAVSALRTAITDDMGNTLDAIGAGVSSVGQVLAQRE